MASKLGYKQFWVNTGLRAVKTLAQTVVGLMAANQAGVTSLHVGPTLIASLLAAMASVLTSVASADEIVPAAPMMPIMISGGSVSSGAATLVEPGQVEPSA